MGLDPNILEAFSGVGKEFLHSRAPQNYKGNLDLTNRQLVKFPNGLDESNSTPDARTEIAAAETKRGTKFFPPGSYGTEFSVTETDGPHYVVMPSIFNGKVHSRKEAVDQYRKTGLHMGKYQMTADGLAQSEKDSELLHNRQQFLNGQPFTGY